MADRHSFLRWTREKPLHPYVGLLAVVTLVTSVWVGIQSQRATQGLSAAVDGWNQASGELAAVKQQFRIPSPTETDAILKESAALSVLGAPSGERVSVMELVTHLAEASELRDIRVAFQQPLPPDSGFVPPRSIGAQTIDQANYSLSLDFTGSFSGLMQFVTSLPPSLSVSRLGASRQADHGSYHVVLAVYELPHGDGSN